MENEKIKVLYIAGPTRSGSTIIGNILGQIAGFFHAGEVIEAWDRGRKWHCSCGQRPAECETWSHIFSLVDAKVDSYQQEKIISIRDKLSKSHKIVFNQIRGLFGLEEKMINTQGSTLISGLSMLYDSIKTETGATVIIDSSKNVGYAGILRYVDTIDLHILHLFRDSRATVYSWSKKKEELWKTNALLSAAVWSSRNYAAELLKDEHLQKYMRIRYEDFMVNPVTTVLEILRFLKIERAELPFVSSDTVKLNISHGLCGNPGRYHHGVEKLILDNRWKNMNFITALIAIILTWPFLLKYKYRFL